MHIPSITAGNSRKRLTIVFPNFWINGQIRMGCSYQNCLNKVSYAPVPSFPSLNRDVDWTAKDDSSEDAWILPTVQLGSIAIRQDEQAIIELLKHLTSGKTEPTKLFITSGYFNFTPAYSSLITNSKAPCEILTASPEANGFFNGKGISGKVPEAYSWILLDFLKRLPHSEPPQLPPSTSSQNASSPTSPLIQVREYKRDGWTYHAKGLWATHGNLSSPFMTTIGSPNFGFRSVQVITMVFFNYEID